MTPLHPDRLAAGGAIVPPRDDTDDPEPFRWGMAAILLFVAVAGVIVAAVYG